jgi:hypothetical protein
MTPSEWRSFSTYQGPLQAARSPCSTRADLAAPQAPGGLRGTKTLSTFPKPPVDVPSGHRRAKSVRTVTRAVSFRIVRGPRTRVKVTVSDVATGLARRIVRSCRRRSRRCGSFSGTSSVHGCRVESAAVRTRYVPNEPTTCASTRCHAVESDDSSASNAAGVCALTPLATPSDSANAKRHRPNERVLDVSIFKCVSPPSSA